MGIWLAQCLCPDRHAILAAAGEAVDEQDATRLIFTVQTAVKDMLRSELNPWCGLCHAPAESWRYEVGRTRFRTMEAAMPDLRRLAAMRAMWGDMPRSG
jgi:hypothetical protein